MPDFVGIRGVGVVSVGTFGGQYFIAGTTSNVGSPNAPVRRKVRLHDQVSGAAVRESWSNSNAGAYSFPGIRDGTYYVTAFDHTGQYGGVIETDIIPEPMP